MAITAEAVAPRASVEEPDHRAPKSRLVKILVALGVLLPLALLTWTAARMAPSFDGGMNLQVAQNVAQGEGYVRYFGELRTYPSEIQTSGLYIYLAALSISVIGPTTFAFQLPNLLFLALMLVAVSWGLRRWPVLQIVGPSVVCFGVPGMREFAMSGYGETVVAALLFTAFVMLDRARYAKRPLWFAAGAFALFGLALTVKVVTAIALPVVAVALVALALVRRDVAWWKWLATLLAIAVPLGIIELVRFLGFGSAEDYGDYWTVQFDKIGGQAGVSDTGKVPQDDPTPLLQTITDHFEILSGSTGLSVEWWILALALAVIVLLSLVVAHRQRLMGFLELPGAILAVQLALYSGGYFTWWLAITPLAKTWLRRILIGALSLAFLYLVLAGMVRDRFRLQSFGSRRPSAIVAWAMAGVSAFVVSLGAVTTMSQQVVSFAKQDTDRVHSVLLLAELANQLKREGAQVYGNGWWSAPVVALYGDLDLENLNTAPACSADSEFVTGEHFLIWDWYALNIASTEPRARYFTFEQIPGSDTGYGGIWRITLKPDACPAGG